MVSMLSAVSMCMHSLIPLQIYGFVIHMLTCKVMMTHKTHLYCLMSLSNSLSSAMSLVPFIDAENEKKRHFYHLVRLFIQITIELFE